MATTDVLRPISVRKDGAATAVPSGTLSSVTSDNSDSTYVRFTNSGNRDNWSLRVGSHTPASNYQRHRIRGRIRIRTDAGTATENINIGRGTSDYIEYDTVGATSSVTEQTGNWYSDAAFGLDTAGALADLNVGGGWIDNVSGATEIRTTECYVDIDCRARPDFSPQVRDASGTDRSNGTVSDTATPTLFVGAVSYDGLPARNWFLNVRTGGVGGPNVYEVFGDGQPPTTHTLTEGLPNGSYTAVFGVRSTIRQADSFEHAVTIPFTLANIVPPPSPPLLSVTPESGGYRVSWTDPGGQMWDDNYVVAEVYRDDCNGSARIATIPDALNGSYLDLAIPQLDPQPTPGDPDCEVSSLPCDLTYRVRYWGYVSTSVELPDNIPADLILAWPSTVGTIPSGWSRVTALDGYYPRGATTTGAPSATGGAASHSHTTPGHVHFIGAHNHEVGGPVGGSSASADANRFNGADYAQADQAHNHTRPAYTGIHNGGSSGITAPGTSVTLNQPATREVIWIKSTGTQVAYPIGALGWATENVSGWGLDTLSIGRYLKGAAASADGGATLGNQGHAHTVNAHVHTGFTHDHTMGNTSQSNPASSAEVSGGGGSPRVLPRHTHPIDVSSESTGSLVSALGGAADTSSIEPPHRRLKVLRNTGGGIQTRIIGLYTGTVAALSDLMTLCDGSNGTPDMRGWFVRDSGDDSVNSTGGSTSHSHTTDPHDHGSPSHNHTTNVLASTTGSITGGGGGTSPTTGHDHVSADAGITAVPVSPASAQNTNAVTHLPTYKEVHFVRLDGTIAGGDLPVPELKTTEFSMTTVPALTYEDGLDRLSDATTQLAVPTDRSHAYPRLVIDSVPLQGGLHSVATTEPGENVTLTIAAQGLPAINALEELLIADRLYWAPAGGVAGWFAPGGWTVAVAAPTVKVLQVTMIRQDWPATPEPGEYL